MSMKTILLIIALCCEAFTDGVECLSFSYPTFDEDVEEDLNMIRGIPDVTGGTIQVTPDVGGASMTNAAGRLFHKKPFKLWRKGKGNHSFIIASFDTTFVINITPKTSPGGEGLAFILAGNPTDMLNSEGQWLGIVNSTTNGSSQAEIVAVEFDTRKSYEQDIDDNHVGLDVNSILSKIQVRLIDYGVNLSSGRNITAKVRYDGKNISVFVISLFNETEEPMENLVFTVPLNLSDFLPQKIYVGFSASTGINNTQLNSILRWEFQSSDIDGNSSQLTWVWITVALVVVALGSAAFFFLYLVREFKEDENQQGDAHPMIEVEIQGRSMAPKKFQLKELRRATGKFNSNNILGSGGFGTVYKGCLGDMEVAVKRFSHNSTQGTQEFVAEVTTIGSLRHKNLVKLIGWCYERHELLIAYEYMPNGSLDKLIFGPLSPSWETRHNIIHGVAKALDYLHNGSDKRVLHRDIKSSNIMLDSEMNARLGDFGLARTIQQSEKTHHTTNEIAGTPGYMAPETFLIGRATVETDIYAFGVLVLEVMSGRRPAKQNEVNNYNNSIVFWVWELYRKGKILDVVDCRLREFEKEQIVHLVLLGLGCCHPNPLKRFSMKTVLKVVEGEANPPLVSTDIPAFVWPPMPSSSFSDYTLGGGTLYTEITAR